MRKLIRILTGSAFGLFLYGCYFGKSKVITQPESSNPSASFYTLSIKSLDGSKNINFADFKGKNVMIVNVASECGFTYQYEDLQKLQDQYQDKLIIIGVPCNQFGNQEPGDSSEIRSFCTKNYGVSFPITEKVDVKGDAQHPVYQWLTQKSKNDTSDFEIKWNFNKVLISETGKLIAYFPSQIKPLSKEITDKIN